MHGPQFSSSGGHGHSAAQPRIGLTYLLRNSQYALSDGVGRSNSAQCPMADVTVVCGHAADHSIDGVHPPQLQATLTILASLLEENHH